MFWGLCLSTRGSLHRYRGLAPPLPFQQRRDPRSQCLQWYPQGSAWGSVTAPPPPPRVRAGWGSPWSHPSGNDSRGDQRRLSKKPLERERSACAWLRCVRLGTESRGRWRSGVVLDSFLRFLCPGGHLFPCSSMQPAQERRTSPGLVGCCLPAVLTLCLAPFCR